MSVEGTDWGSVADWASAAGSILASVVALYLARSAQRVSATALCGIREISDMPGRSFAWIKVTNTGERPFKVASVSLSHGLMPKKHGFIKMDRAGAFRDPLMVPLNDGDSGHYGFPLDEDNWVSQQASTFRSFLDVRTFRITLHLSNNQSIRIKPEKPLMDHMKEVMTQAKSRTKSD